MSSFSVHIATDNAAFGGANLADELARVLRSVAYKLDHGTAELDRDDHRYGANVGTMLDDNGTTVGRWFWTDRDQVMDDAAALDRIQLAVSGKEWNSDTCEPVTDALQCTGREVLDYDEGADA